MERKKKQLSPLEQAVYEDVRLKQIRDTTIEEQLIGNFIGFQGFGFKDCVSLITADDFADQRMAKLFAICDDLHKRGVEINIATVYAEIMRAGINSISIADLTAISTVDRSVPAELANYVKEMSRRRKLSDTFMQATHDVLDPNADANEVAERVRKVIDGLNAEIKKNFVAIGEPMAALMNEVVKRSNGEAVEGIKSGFAIIDEKGGLQLSDLNIVAGDTSAGKTSLAMCIIKNVAASGVPCAVYSMEMSATQMAARLLSVGTVDRNDDSCVSGSDILYMPLDYATFNKVDESYRKVSGLPIYIDTRASHSIEELAMNIRSMVYTTGVKVVMVDYIQLIGSKQATDEVRQMDIIARELKVVAAELNICVIALSQLNRPKDGINPVPNLRRLRNSGGIEQAADNIYLIYRAEVYNKAYPGGWSTYPTKGTALLMRAKGRSIGLAERLLKFIPKATAYFDYHHGGEPLAAGNDLPSSQQSGGVADWMNG